VFVLSVIVSDDNSEQDLFGSDEVGEAVLGAFRPKRTLPSGSHHSVQVHDGDDNPWAAEGGGGANNNYVSGVGTGAGYILEVVLSDGTSYDALVVACYWLDREIVSKQTRLDAIATLQKIIANVVKDPGNDKYRKLRLSNAMVSKNIGKHWSAMDFLRVLGFQRKTIQNCSDAKSGGDDAKEEYLIAEGIPDDSKLALYAQAQTLLQQLQTRCQPGFVADLAPPTPWDEPVLFNNNHHRGGGGGGGGGGNRWGNAGSTNFVTPEDRWARVERARRFRSRAGPRPSPGNAPSDRGRWGR